MSTAPHTERTPLAEIRLGRSVSIEQAGQLMSVSRRTVYNRIREGRLRTIRTSGGSQRVLVESLYELGFRPHAFSTSASAATFAIRSIRNPNPPAVIESPPVTHEQRTSISTVRSKAYTGLICIAALFLSVTDVSAQARMSADLEDRLLAGDNAATSVIVTGTQGAGGRHCHALRPAHPQAAHVGRRARRAGWAAWPPTAASMPFPATTVCDRTWA